eukprot:3166191-Rhodomonas_salina.2
MSLSSWERQEGRGMGREGEMTRHVSIPHARVGAEAQSRFTREKQSVIARWHLVWDGECAVVRG